MPCAPPSSGDGSGSSSKPNHQHLEQLTRAGEAMDQALSESASLYSRKVDGLAQPPARGARTALQRPQGIEDERTPRGANGHSGAGQNSRLR